MFWNFCLSFFNQTKPAKKKENPREKKVNRKNAAFFLSLSLCISLCVVFFLVMIIVLMASKTTCFLNHFHYQTAQQAVMSMTTTIIIQNSRKKRCVFLPHHQKTNHHYYMAVCSSKRGRLVTCSDECFEGKLYSGVFSSLCNVIWLSWVRESSSENKSVKYLLFTHSVMLATLCAIYDCI